jgi:hypothetical protein
VWRNAAAAVPVVAGKVGEGDAEASGTDGGRLELQTLLADMYSDHEATVVRAETRDARRQERARVHLVKASARRRQALEHAQQVHGQTADAMEKALHPFAGDDSLPAPPSTSAPSPSVGGHVGAGMGMDHGDDGDDGDDGDAEPDEEMPAVPSTEQVAFLRPRVTWRAAFGRVAQTNETLEDILRLDTVQFLSDTSSDSEALVAEREEAKTNQRSRPLSHAPVGDYYAHTVSVHRLPSLAQVLADLATMPTWMFDPVPADAPLTMVMSSGTFVGYTPWASRVVRLARSLLHGSVASPAMRQVEIHHDPRSRSLAFLSDAGRILVRGFAVVQETGLLKTGPTTQRLLDVIGYLVRERALLDARQDVVARLMTALSRAMQREGTVCYFGAHALQNVRVAASIHDLNQGIAGQYSYVLMTRNGQTSSRMSGTTLLARSLGLRLQVTSKGIQAAAHPGTDLQRAICTGRVSVLLNGQRPLVANRQGDDQGGRVPTSTNLKVSTRTAGDAIEDGVEVSSRVEALAMNYLFSSSVSITLYLRQQDAQRARDANHIAARAQNPRGALCACHSTSRARCNTTHPHDATSASLQTIESEN